MTLTGSRIAPRGQPVVHDGVRLDLVEQVAEEITDRASALGLRSAPSLNRGGWRSDSLLGWSSPATRALLATLREMTAANEMEAWAMINWRGSQHPRHLHRGALAAGVYYVLPGDPETSPTIFEPAEGPEIYVEPLAGRLVLFPANLYHRVPTYQGSKPRITVAFDVKT